MKEQLAALKAQYDAKINEGKALLAKGQEMTAEDVLTAEKCRDDAREIGQKMASFQSADGLSSEFESLIKLATQPAAGALLGLNPAGETQIERTAKNGLAVEHVGEGLIPQKQFDAIRQPAYKEAWFKYVSVGWAAMTGSEQKTLQEGSDSAGGFLVPEDVLNRVIMRQPTPTRVAGRVTSLNTSRDALTMPKVNYSTDDLYSTGIRVTWTGEVPSSSTVHRVTDPVFGSVRIPVYTAMLSEPVTNDLIEDSAVALEPWLEARFNETIDLLFDNMVLNGAGVGQPSGILVNPNAANNPATVNTGDASALTGDGLIDLTEAVPEQYDENSVLVFNKTNTGKAIRKLKDGDGRPLVSYGAGDFGLASGRYKEVNGYPYIWSGFMPNVGANTYPIIFGDLRGYYLVRRVGFSIQVLRELYAETNQILLLGRIRFGGLVAEDWRLKIQKVAA